MTTSPYSQNDLLLLIGQCTVELAFLRARIAELEARLEQQKMSPNGIVDNATHDMEVLS